MRETFSSEEQDGVTRSPLFFIVAGETSGDIHAANLIRELRRLCPTARFAGLGGQRMEEAGCDLLYNLVDNLALMLFMAVFTQLRTILDVRGRALDFIERNSPDLVILIDFPGFNLNLAGKLRKRSVRVAYYILPQIWAWGEGRWRKLRDRTGKRLAILPFEKDWYAQRGVHVDYVGHPLYDHLESVKEVGDLREVADVRPGQKLLGLLPGSRRQEFLKNLPVMLRICGMVLKDVPDTKVVMSPIPGLSRNAISSEAERQEVAVTVAEGSTYRILRQADLCLAASGTVTLELAYFETPMVVLYRVNPIEALLGKLLLRVEHMSLVNLVGGREIVPEFLMWRDTCRDVADETVALLSREGARREQIEGMRRVNSRMGARPGATARAARVLVEFVEGETASPT